jgi:anti-sigma regulatory factor (Ser/Thr protein kinase)
MEIKDEEILLECLKSIKIINNSASDKIINLENKKLITPFFITPLTAHINRYKLDFNIIYPLKKEPCDYLSLIKFPSTITNKLDLSTSTKYSPLYEIKNEVLGENKDILEILREIIVDEYKLKENLSTLMLVFDEMMCNIQEHAKSNFNCIQTQRYKNKIAISIVDTGITIPQNYIENGLKGYDSNLELFKLVFQGISTKKEKERGTGIPNTYNLVCNALKGSFSIISGNVGFIKLPDTDLQFFSLEDDLNLNFEGTIINILFDVPKEKIDYTKYLNQPI